MNSFVCGFFLNKILCMLHPSQMNVGYIFFPILELCVILFCCYFCFHFQTPKKTPKLVSFYFIFSLVLCMTQLALLPLDFNNYLYDRCKATTTSSCESYSRGVLDYDTLTIIWTIVYWLNFVNIWYILFIPL